LGGEANTNIYTTHTNVPFALFSNIQSLNNSNTQYWTSTPTNDADKHSVFSFFWGVDSTDNKNIGHSAMAVATIPEPETYAMLLAGLGLVGFVARRRKQIS
jgi:PEP-CTERM motif